MIFCALEAGANWWRGRGDRLWGPLLLRRAVCGLLASASLLFHAWPGAGIDFAISALLSTLAFTVFPHGPGLDGSTWPRWLKTAYMSVIGLACTAPAAYFEAFTYGNIAGATALVLGGLCKGPAYLLPRGPGTSKFGWRELTTGAAIGLGVDVAAWAR